MFVDSRIELFDAAVWDDYMRILEGEDGWETVLDRYEVDAVALSNDQDIVIDRLSHDPDWVKVARSEDGAVFVRA